MRDNLHTSGEKNGPSSNVFLQKDVENLKDKSSKQQKSRKENGNRKRTDT